MGRILSLKIIINGQLTRDKVISLLIREWSIKVR